ncbi:helix-turn-helix, psq domain-containing protein [Hirsutella rhossiliensis]
MTATGDQSVPREERVLLAVRAYQQGQFKSTRKAAAAYDVPQSTVSDRLRGVIRRRDAQMNNLKLTATEETALVQWILSMDERGMPPTVAYTRRMANLLLSERGKDPVGKTGPPKDPRMVRSSRGDETEMGILDEDVYNFDETGFQMESLQRRDLEIENGLLENGWTSDDLALNCHVTPEFDKYFQVDKVGNDHGDKNTKSQQEPGSSQDSA